MRLMESEHRKRAQVLAVGLAVLISACSPATNRTPSGDGESTAKPAAPKHITLAMSGDPPFLYQKLNIQNTIRGIVSLEQLVNVGLTIRDENFVLHPRLAEAIPTVGNGLWQVLPDGTMTTTWHLKPNSFWHDGTPVTADDLAFTARVARDRDLPVFGTTALQNVATADAPDPRTVVVRWKAPYIQADAMFSPESALPLPKHLLESAYLDPQQKPNFEKLPYWNQEFIGTGPFKLKDWTIGSHLTLSAFDQYVLGRPKIDEVDVRFILDSNTISANLLAGVVDVTLDRTLSIEQAVQLEQNWDGQFQPGPLTSGLNEWPQLLTPNPTIIGDARFRRALLQAMDRQQMVDTFMLGRSQVMHSWFAPYEPEYAEFESRILKYDYDPRAAVQAIEGLGYVRGADGTFRDASGRELRVETRTVGQDINSKTMLAIADYWQRAGVAVDPAIIPTERQPDQEYRATFPGFDLERGSPRVETLDWFLSTSARLPENNFRGGGTGTGNYARYMNPELDAMVNKFFTTIPRHERMAQAAEVVHFATDQVLLLPTFYDITSVLVSKRMRNVGPDKPWNSNEWDVAN